MLYYRILFKEIGNFQGLLFIFNLFYLILHMFRVRSKKRYNTVAFREGFHSSLWVFNYYLDFVRDMIDT